MSDVEALTPAGRGERTAPSKGSVSVVHSNAALLGDVAWLMLRLEGRRDWRVAEFSRMVMPALGRRQFRLYYDGVVPIAFISWALLSAEVKTRFFDDPFSLRPEEWSCGEEACIVDFAVLPGAMRKIARYLRRDPLISERPVVGVRMRRGFRRMARISTGPDGRPHIEVEPLDRPRV
jgi:hemolysin-activating ACP:hemolysin acyltransferase